MTSKFLKVEKVVTEPTTVNRQWRSTDCSVMQINGDSKELLNSGNELVTASVLHSDSQPLGRERKNAPVKREHLLSLAGLLTAWFVFPTNSEHYVFPPF